MVHPTPSPPVLDPHFTFRVARVWMVASWHFGKTAGTPLVPGCFGLFQLELTLAVLFLHAFVRLPVNRIWLACRVLWDCCCLSCVDSLLRDARTGWGPGGWGVRPVLNKKGAPLRQDIPQDIPPP